MKTPISFLLFVVCFLFAILAQAAPKVGDPVPNFSAMNQNGKKIQLVDYKGKFLLVYFYPADDTPGCTAEANQLKKSDADFKKLNAAVLGVSRQDEKSHRQFIDKHQLPFDLLVDKDGEVARTLGVGSIPVVNLAKRQSLLIGPDGRLLKFYEDVTPDRHAEEVLEDIRRFKK